MDRQADLVTLGMAQANRPHPWERSLTDTDAAMIVEQYARLLMNTGATFDTPLANKLLADGFRSHADCPSPAVAKFGAVSVASKQAFINNRSSVAASIAPSIRTTIIYHSCGEIMWRFQINETLLSLSGMSIFLINASKQVDAVFMELSSNAVVYNKERPARPASPLRAYIRRD